MNKNKSEFVRLKRVKTKVFARVNAMKKKTYIILILVCVLMAFVGIIIWGVMQKQDNLKENTVIEINGETSKTLKAELTGFYPGNEQEYKIILKGDSADNYEITLNFRNDEKHGTLGNYLIVKITTKDMSIEKKLKDLLDGEKIELGKNANEIYVSYAMPENTGNEAQGTTAAFYIDLTAKTNKR